MALIEFHHATDGRPVSFENHLVLIMEPHDSGTGTFVRLGPPERTHDLHLTEDYASVKREVTKTWVERWISDSSDDPDLKPPF